MNLSVALFDRVFLPLVGLPHGRHRMAAARGAAFAAAVRMVDRVHGRRRDCADGVPSQRLRPALPIDVFMWSGFDTAPTVAKHWP